MRGRFTICLAACIVWATLPAASAGGPRANPLDDEAAMMIATVNIVSARCHRFPFHASHWQWRAIGVASAMQLRGHDPVDFMPGGPNWQRVIFHMARTRDYLRETGHRKGCEVLIALAERWFPELYADPGEINWMEK